jgi:replicative DNA helicase
MISEEKPLKIDEAFQDMVLACMQRVPEFNAVTAGYISPDHFDGPVRKNLSRMMIDFWAGYGALVSDTSIVILLKDLVTAKKIEDHDVLPHLKKYKELRGVGVTEWKFILDKMVTFIKHQKIKALIEKSVKTYLPKGEHELIEREMAAISSINSKNRVQPYDYYDFDAINERSAIRKKELETGKISISTGIPELDAKMHAHGFYQKELYIFMAPPKRGKTMSLLWFANQAALQGYNVAHFTCEVSQEVCAKRLDAMNSKTLIHDVVKRHEAVCAHVVSRAPRGKLMLFEYPTKSLSPQMIDHQVERLTTEFGISTNMIVVDYLDILKHPSQHGSENNWSSQGPIAEELRGLAGKYCVPVISATQVNRGGAGKAVTTGKDVAGNYEKIMIADEIYTLSATDEELKENILRINNSESRNSESGTVVINTKFAYGQFYASSIGEEV